MTRQDAAATPTIYTYPTSSHRLGDVAGVSRLFDANGNTRQIGTNQFFTYDERNRMVDFRSSSSIIVRKYEYNAKGERVRKYRNALTHASYLYDESGRLLSETKTNLIGNIVTQDIIWLDDMPIGLSQNGALHGILTDHLNAPRQVFLTSTQAVQWRWDLVDNAFGEKPAVASGVDLDLRFPGQLYDGESGLHYNYFRDYEPGTGRYAQSDPIELAGGINTYEYSYSSPYKYSDNLGLNSMPRNYSPGPGGNAAQRRVSTREFLRGGGNLRAPNIPGADPYGLKTRSPADPYNPAFLPRNGIEASCDLLNNSGLDLCGPGSRYVYICLESECASPVFECNTENPHGSIFSKPKPMHAPIGYSNPNCRCLYGAFVER